MITTKENIHEVAQQCADNILSKSEGILGVRICIPFTHKEYANGFARLEGQLRLTGVTYDVFELHRKIGEDINITSKKCNMMITSLQFDDVYVVVAYEWRHSIAKSLRRMLQRSVKKLVVLAEREAA